VSIKHFQRIFPKNFKQKLILRCYISTRYAALTRINNPRGAVRTGQNIPKPHRVRTVRGAVDISSLDEWKRFFSLVEESFRTQSSICSWEGIRDSFARWTFIASVVSHQRFRWKKQGCFVLFTAPHFPHVATTRQSFLDHLSQNG